MEPYQKAAEKLRTSGEYPLNLAKNIGLSAIGGGAAKLGSSALASLLPKVKALINEYVPDELSKKGLEKLDPRFGQFIKGGEQEGYDYGEIRKFIGEKVDKSEQENAKQSKNIIEQYSPELHQFIDNEVKGGRTPTQAAAIAQNDKKFQEIIKKLSKDHKTPWSSIVESIYGTPETAPIQRQQQQDQQIQQEQPQQQGISPEKQQFLQIVQQLTQQMRQ